MLQTNNFIRKEVRGKNDFAVEKVTTAEVESGVQKIMSTLSVDTIRRFDEIFLNRTLGKKVFVSQHVEVDKFAYIMSTFHIKLNNQNTDTVAELGKIFLFTENKFLKILSGLALRRLNWKVQLPMEADDVKEATYKMVGLALKVGNDLCKTYC
jgi:hypothetical protein